MSPGVAAALGGLVGTVLGALSGVAWMLVSQARVKAELEAAKAREQALRERLVSEKELLERARDQLKEAFAAVGRDVLHDNSAQFLVQARATLETLLAEAKGDTDRKKEAIEGLLKPIEKLLEKQNEVIGGIELKRERAYASLEEQVRIIGASHEKLGSATTGLLSALRRPEQRGRWGELQLRNVVELAGITAHCDFDEQPVVPGESRLRPDMTVRLPGGGVIVVDSKVALDAYLDALQPDADRAACLKRHAEQVDQHYRRLAAKKYWEQFERAPQVAVMFMPLESALVAALEVRPDLHAEAMAGRVLIATPTLLVALLRAAAYGWQQEAVAENARQIADAGRELYERLARFADHLQRAGASLVQAGAGYNAAIGSLERMVLPSARRLKALQATDAEDVERPPLVTADIRPITAPELLPTHRADGPA